MKKFLEEFKAFAMRGNVIDLAVGMIIGGAFGKITNSLVNDVIMPAFSMVLGSSAFEQWKLILRPAEGDVAEIAIRYGLFLSTLLDFIILAFAIFCVIKLINKLHAKKEEPQEEEKDDTPPPPTTEDLLSEIRDLLKGATHGKD